MIDICPNCEKETEIELISRIEDFIIRGKSISAEVTLKSCIECHVEFENTRDKDVLENVYREYR